jgi:hypothetical protein
MQSKVNCLRTMYSSVKYILTVTFRVIWVAISGEKFFQNRISVTRFMPFVRATSISRVCRNFRENLQVLSEI